MKIKTDYVILAVLLLLLVGATLLWRRPLHGQPRDHSVWRTNREGYRALYALAQRLRLPVSDLRRPWTDLPRDAGMLCLIDPTHLPLRDEVNALLEWVRAGHILLLTPQIVSPDEPLWGPLGEDYAVDLFEKLDLSLTHVGPKVSKTRMRPSSELAAGVRQIRLLHNTRLERHGAAFEVLARDESGPAIVALQKGRGLIYVLTDPDLLSNVGLRYDDNAILGVNLLWQGAQHGRVYFDEYHHGFREAHSRWAALGATPPGRALWPLLAAVAIYLFGRIWRFGAPITLQRTQHRSALEHVQAFAHVYQSAGAGQAALGLILDGFRRRLARRVGANPGRPLAELADIAESRDPHAAGLRDVVAGAHRAAALPDLEERELLHWARRLAYYEQEGS